MITKLVLIPWLRESHLSFVCVLQVIPSVLIHLIYLQFVNLSQHYQYLDSHLLEYVPLILTELLDKHYFCRCEKQTRYQFTYCSITSSDTLHPQSWKKVTLVSFSHSLLTLFEFSWIDQALHTHFLTGKEDTNIYVTKVHLFGVHRAMHQENEAFGRPH